jgi:hypothetical protein
MQQDEGNPSFWQRRIVARNKIAQGSLLEERVRIYEVLHLHAYNFGVSDLLRKSWCLLNKNNNSRIARRMSSSMSLYPDKG